MIANEEMVEEENLIGDFEMKTKINRIFFIDLQEDNKSQNYV